MTFELEPMLRQIMVNFTKGYMKDYFNKIILMVIFKKNDSKLLLTF
jgi:hypothetical protein